MASNRIHVKSWCPKKVSIIFLFLLLTLFMASCSLPDIKEVSREAEITHKTPEIVGAKGKLPPQTSKAIIKKLEKQAGPTDILQRNIALMEAISGSPLVAGNKVTLLIDGPATYASMSEAILHARDHINFETYIFEDDEVGKRFADLLLQKQKEGVQVNLIYDSVGCLGTPASFFKSRKEGGVQTLEFNPINPLKIRREWLLNHRDHRKMLVVDGKIAFTGGVNISEVYTKMPSGGLYGTVSGFPYNPPSGNEVRGPEKSWRDTEVRIEGPAVAEFQKLFLDTWQRQKGPELSKRNYFPPLKPQGKDLVEVVGSTPETEKPITYLMYMSAFTHAEISIHLTTSYFVPDKQTIKALTDAARRGVDVKMVLPGYSDISSSFYAGRSHYTKLLKSGVKLYERREAVLHAKTAVIDGVWSTVGSTNMDLWSFMRDDEVNAIILGRDFAGKMEEMFAKDLKASDPILLEQWEERSLGERLREIMWSIVAYWL
jgi:cardiolipin synthase